MTKYEEVLDFINKSVEEDKEKLIKELNNPNKHIYRISDKCIKKCNLDIENLDELIEENEERLIMRKKVQINCKFEGDELPKYEKQGDSAMDLRAWKFREVNRGELLPEQDFTEEGYVLQPFDRILIPTGLKLELPEDIDADVRPRSGLTLKNGIMVALGTIDSPYTGDVGMIVMNLSKDEFLIKRGDRLGQLKFSIPVEAELNVVNEIHTTNRGEKGFGSSGV